MSSSGVNLENYLIPLEEINLATENFSQQRCIGGGGFGAVYRGQLSERWQNRTVAIKRLGRDSHQGEHEFRNELEMICRFHHENIIAFIGYCDEGGEMIIVYDYAANGSLDHHLRDSNKMRYLTWKRRLEICIGAARGLNYLHSGLEKENRVIHRDVKSGNILLDENLVAKICDFGLSKLGPKNLPNTQLITKVAGTQFYLDPTYYESRILRKESDVYSFGIVLFEMLSGRLVYSETTTEDERSQLLMTSVRGHNKNNLRELIDPNIKVQIHTDSFNIFIKIAYECINFNVMDRPKMEIVVKTLEEALIIQRRSDVFVNGQFLTESVVDKAKMLAGPIHPGEYWYDSIAGFWGVMNQSCVGIIPPFIKEFDYPMPKNCSAGNTRVFVNGRELNQKDLDLLAGRGLPTTTDKSYIIDISGKVVDEATGEELDSLGKLAPTVERYKHGFGMKVPKAVVST